MKKVNKKSLDNCPICGQFMEVLCSGYRHSPFADGKCYEYICQGCHEVPCTKRFVEDSWMWQSYEYGTELHTVEEMISFGWDKKSAIKHIKAVKAAIKKRSKKQ